MICPHCGEESFAKKKNILSGWKITGSVEVCALCGAEWQSAESGKAPENPNLDRLSALLGGEKAEKVTLAGEADRAFCRNCRHFLAHPFKCVCSVTQAEISPMDEGCNDFFDAESTRK